MLPQALVPGDEVSLISSPPTAGSAVEVLSGWGLAVRASDVAETDEEQAAQVTAALRDPAVRALVVAGADIGTYRIIDLIDLDAAQRDPKPVVGVDDVTRLHLSLWRRCGLGGIHGTPAGALAVAGAGHRAGAAPLEALRRALMVPEPVRLCGDPGDITAAVSVGGRAEGILIGGNLSAVRGAVGVDLPGLDGTILLLTDARRIGLGQVDRQLTQLLRSGALHGVRAVAVGRFTGFDGYVDRDWTLVDVLRERLSPLGVPVLGGLPVGHGPDQLPVPLGTTAALDADAGTLVVEPVVR